MKYLLIFLLSFIISAPVLAAKSVEGTVPQLAPLQPPPEGISPNYNKNIQSKAPTYYDPAVGDSDSSQNNPGDASGNDANTVKSDLSEFNNINSLWSKAPIWLSGSLGVLFLVLVFVLWAYYKKSRAK